MIRPDGRLLRSFDWPWFLAILALSAIGALAIWSTTANTGIHSYFFRQLIYIGCGLVVFLVLLRCDYHLFSDFIGIIYIGGLVVLTLVLVIGYSVHGNKSWINLGAFSVQPSEFMKIVVLIALAKYYADLDSEQLSLRELLIGAAIVMGPAFLVLLQGDLGTTVTYMPIYAALSLLAGIRRKHLLIALALALVATPVVWFGMLRDYQKERIETIFNPSSDPSRIGYQTIQSEIAIGSGRFLGKGLRQGSQGHLGFLPARHTDFVFSVLAEEKGFVGSITILALFLFVLFRLFRTAFEARDKVGTLLVSGIAALIMFHVVINIGMGVGMFPVVGVPLPFISAGGSSLITCFAAMGLAMSVRLRRYVN